MTARRILTWPSPLLKESAEPISQFDNETKDLAIDLYHTMLTSFGAGIAATQIGVKKSMCVISPKYAPSLPIEKNVPEGDCVVLINPEIESTSNKSFLWEEGCLSVPEVQAKVKRKKQITVTYQNLDGDQIKKQVIDEESATIQHEVDHLFGRLFISRLTGLSKLQAMKTLRNYLRKQNTDLPVSKKPSKPKRKKKARVKRKKIFGKNKKK